MRVYLDTSAVLASLKRKDEPEHKTAKRIVESSPSVNEIVSSSLLVTELSVAYAKHTKAPAEAVLRAIGVLKGLYGLQIFNHDDFLDVTKDLAFEKRVILRKADLPAADVHHVAAAFSLNAKIFVTTDFRHLLKKEVKDELKNYIQIVSPREAVGYLISHKSL